MNKWLNQFLEKPDISDNTDRFGSNINMSDLSGRPQGLLKENLGNTSEIGPDISDRFDPSVNMSGLSGRSPSTFNEDSLCYDFEERLAIAEQNGYQTPIQAQRIAYLDAFISILSNLAEADPQKDWLAQKIQTAITALEAQSFPTMH